jgi:PDZ domain-containing protein
MKQRGMTVLVGAIAVILLSSLVARAPVPYVAMEPGISFDTLGVDDEQQDIIDIDGVETSESAGQLRFLTVSVVSDLTLVDAVAGWISDEDAVVPRELFYKPGVPEEVIRQENRDIFVGSLSGAQMAALTYLGYPLVVGIREVSPDSPNAALLKAGDIVTAVDGTPVPTPDALLTAIRAKEPGSTLTLALIRDGAPTSALVMTYPGPDGTARVGFTPEVRPETFTISIPIEGIGGPSAGLMLALGIVDKLTPEDLTGGRVIAGTGSICRGPDDPSNCGELGAVGEIGGIAQKIVSALAADATVLLVPDGNCAEAAANARPGLMLVRVDTLRTALDALATLRSGGTPQLCS